jgi:uncharacterized protein (DUF427 family)
MESRSGWHSVGLVGAMSVRTGTENQLVCKATCNDAVLAKSDQCIEVERNEYFPLERVNQYLKPSEHTSVRPWKGMAHYYDVEVNGQRNPNAALYYPQPKRAAERIRAGIAFCKGVNAENLTNSSR